MARSRPFPGTSVGTGVKFVAVLMGRKTKTMTDWNAFLEAAPWWTWYERARGGGGGGGGGGGWFGRGGVPWGPLASMARAVLAPERQLLEKMLADRGIGIPSDWLLREWKVGAGEGSIWIPYFNRVLEDSGKSVLCCKRRVAPDWDRRWIADMEASGRVFYGLWRLGSGRNVLLVEGESDTWTASWALRDSLSWGVLGVPGAVPPGQLDPGPEGLCALAGRGVLVAFDGDAAGNVAADYWERAGARVLYVPEGEDITSLGGAWLRERLV